jgi:hypothetical protein
MPALGQLKRDRFSSSDWDRLRAVENYNNYHLVPIVAVFLTLSYVALGLRLWTRGRMKHILGWDDLSMAIAQVLSGIVLLSCC